MKRMSSRQLSEWIAFFQLEAEDARQQQLGAQAKRGVEETIRKRKRKS